ncbi:MAG: hypothetical protein FWF10_09020 [Clostridiales bacterium]|nr:hypothetical protein [Clostridiales bacterium]
MQNAERIIALQLLDGSWGRFHSLAQPTKACPMTTEQALRRLRALGLTREDEPVARALDYMRACLSGKLQLPDRREKVLNWDAFEAHMLSAWIRCFAPEDPLALPIAQMWADLITTAFQSGQYDEDAYAEAYRKRIPVLHRGERRIAVAQFYMVELLKGMLDAETEGRFVDYIIHNPGGIYYVCDACIAEPPPDFASKQASRYIAALELLADYPCAPEKLRFAKDWLLANKNADGTLRIERLLQRL